MIRLIDAWALMEYCNNTKDNTIDANDIARFPTALGWISTKEKLPDSEREVLALSEKGAFIVLNYSPKWKAFNAHDRLETNGHEVNVDYWMDIPKAPDLKEE